MSSRCVLLLVLSSVMGCGDDGAELAPVRGKVTLDGEPLAGASVGFAPVASGSGEQGEAGSASYGTTDQDGIYELKTVFGDDEGAVVGGHRVTISIAVAAKDPTDDRVIPGAMSDKLHPNYSNASKLTFTVPAGGTESADFALTKDGKLPQGSN